MVRENKWIMAGGALGALAISALRCKVSFSVFLAALRDSMRTTAMIFLVLIGAEIFSLFLGVSRLPMHLSGYIGALELPGYLTLSAILLLYVALGCILDGIAMMILTIPVIFPLIESMGLDPIWFGVLLVIVLEMGLITPPVGMNVFVIKGVAEDVPLSAIFKGICPFLVANLIAIAVIAVFPEVALYIPSKMR